MKLFITGLNGFIGRSLIEIIPSEWEILSLVRSNKLDSNYKNLKEIYGTLSNPCEWEKIVQDFSADCCIHLAWDGIPNYDLKMCRENLNQNLIFLEAITKIGIPKILISGSCWEYGELKGKLKEDQIPISPSDFAISKLTIKAFLENLKRKYGIKYIWARIFFCYGPGQKELSLIPSLWRNIKNNMEINIKTPFVSQDYVFIGDITKAILELIENSVPSGTYNLGSGYSNYVAEIANMVFSYYSLPLPYKQFEINDKNKFYANLEKTRKILRWFPNTSLKEGIHKTLKDLDFKNGFN